MGWCGVGGGSRKKGACSLEQQKEMNKGVAECTARKFQNLLGKWGHFPSEQRVIRLDPGTQNTNKSEENTKGAATRLDPGGLQAAHLGVRPATRHRCTWGGAVQAGCGVRCLQAGA